MLDVLVAWAQLLGDAVARIGAVPLAPADRRVKSNTTRMRWSTRRAVSGYSNQMGSNTSITLADRHGADSW
jgi:hypothetical protein